MKDYIFIYKILLGFLLLPIIAKSQGIVTLNTDYSGETHIVEAKSLVKMVPGFRYQADGNKYFKSTIGKVKSITNASYLEDPTPGYDRVLSTSANIGSIPGSYSVNPSGAATYSIPIATPKGINGLKPKIAINYNSRGRDGVLGYRWNLSGISLITRGTKSLLQDGDINSVSFNNNSDRFFLNGKRLICTSGTYGDAGSEYRTEIDNLSKITLLNDDDGKLFFKVQTANGRVLKYKEKVLTGNDEVMYWALKTIDDLDGFRIFYNYINNNNELNIDNIQYANNRIDFYYSKRADTNFNYFQGEYIQQQNILRQIKVFTNDNLYREYDFIYAANKKLYEIQLKAGDDSEINSTIIDWEETSINNTSTSLDQVTLDYSVKYGDFNGDGRTDILTYSNGSG